MEAKIFHNPRCSKSRQALALLLDRGIEPEIIEYLKVPPNHKTLKKILEMLGIEAIDLIRKNEPLFKKLSLEKSIDNPKILIDAMIENPILIERPIFVTKDKAVIGRPPELVLEII